ncbi:hypothetical protein T07_12416 [Trichinella nelsoni]|uniref:Uncharacterized protein n=1 Tax=Trichinella nelsoni TaxID=6336 RepID=A0A0V0RML4_9BILA|nr:hypothetical protein T07_12416 [Trichinella nelsoni]
MYKLRAKRFPRLPRDRPDLVPSPEFTRTKSGKTFPLMPSATGIIGSTKKRLGLYKLIQLLKEEQGVMETLINHRLSRNPTVGSIRPRNRVSCAQFIISLCTKIAFGNSSDVTRYHFTIHAIVASKLVPVVCCYVRLKILANKTSINKAAVLSVNLYPQTIICNFEIALIPLC